MCFFFVFFLKLWTHLGAIACFSSSEMLIHVERLYEKEKCLKFTNKERGCGSQVSTKTVTQCVEFYYTYKKRVKTGRNGTLTYGETEPLESKTTEEEMDRKVSLKPCFTLALQKIADKRMSV